MRRKKCNLVGIVLVLAMLCPLQIFAADDLPSMFSEGKTSIHFKAIDFSRDYEGFNDAAGGFASIYGGRLDFETAALKGVSLGTGVRTQQEMRNLERPEYGYYTGLTSDSSSEMAQAYIRYRGFDTTATVGRQYIDTPYMNMDDIRILPLVYQGAGVTNTSIKNFKVDLGYFTRWADWNDTYKDMLVDADGNSVPAEYIGVTWDKIIPGLQADMWYYNFTDNYTLWSPMVKYFKMLNPKKNMKYAVDFRYAKWDDTGDAAWRDKVAYKTSGAIDTYMYGGTALFSYTSWTFMAAVQVDGDGELLDSFGNRRIITTQIGKASRARETAYLGHVAYDFSSLGLKGFSLTCRYGIYDTPETGKYASVDRTDLDFSGKYVFGNKALKGLSLRADYGILTTDSDYTGPGYTTKGAADATDVRFYLMYDF